MSRITGWVRAVVVAALICAAGSTAQARTGDVNLDAKNFLTAIYRAYIGPSEGLAKGVRLDDADSIRRYFSPGLASLIIEEGVSARQPGEPLVIGSDPFVGRGSWDIANLAIEVKEFGPAKAIGTVSFTNFGQPEKVTVELLKVGDWRITEITWGSLTLRTLYRKKWQAALETGATARR